MRRILLSIVLPFFLLLLVGGGIWWFVRSRATSPFTSPVTQGTSVTPEEAAQTLPPPAPPQGLAVPQVRPPTAADRAGARETLNEPFPASAVKEGEPTYLITQGVPDEPTPAPASVPTPGPSTPAPASVPGTADQDGDTLTTDQERQQGTSPTLADTDRDGLLDGDEVRTWRTSPTRADTDADGLPDGEEANRWRTDPLNPDTDGDAYPDGAEVTAGYNPNGPGKL